MSIDPKFVELAADVFETIFYKAAPTIMVEKNYTVYYIK